MGRMRALALAAAASTLLAGCVTPNFVQVSSTTFRSPNLAQPGTLRVAPLNDEQRSSLEFQNVASMVSSEFQKSGFLPATAGAPTNYTAYVTYGIDNGRSEQVAVPIFGQTGGGTTFVSGSSSGAGGFRTYNATATTMPTFGIVGAASTTQRVYRRQLAVDVFDTSKSPPEKVAEVRAQSEGSCGNIHSVIGPIVSAAVASFSGENGRTKTVKVPWSGEC